MTCTDVIDSESGFACDSLQCSDVRRSKVHDVDIVAYTCSVVGRIIVPEDTESLAFTDSHLGDIGHEVIGYAIRVLAYSAGRVCANRIEVTQ